MKSFVTLMIVCLALVFAPVLSHAAARERLLDIQEVTSPGGIKAWLVQDSSLPIIAIQFAFMGAGTAQDPAEKQGLTILVSNTMDEGAGEYDSATFQQMMTDNNITLTFGAGRDDFSGYFKILSRDKELGFKLLRLAVNEARFDEEPLARMRAANMTRIRSSLSDPDWMASRLINDAAFAGHPYGLNSGGTLSTLPAVTAQDLKTFARTRLARENLRVGVMGDITADELKTVLDDIFGALPEKPQLVDVPALTVQNGGQVVLYKRDIPQTMIEMMQPGIGREDPDYYTGMVMNFILGSSGFGSRLTEEIREKRGLTYGISSYFLDQQKVKVLGVSTSTKNESAGELLSLVKAEWEKMRNEPVTAEELSAAKSYLIGSFPLTLSSTDNIAGLLLSLQLDDLPLDYLDRRAERINAVTAKDVETLAQRLLDPAAMVTVLVGNPANVAATKTVETLPNAE